MTDMWAPSSILIPRHIVNRKHFSSQKYFSLQSALIRILQPGPEKHSVFVFKKKECIQNAFCLLRIYYYDCCV